MFSSRQIELSNSGQLLKRLIGDPYPVVQALRRAQGPVTIIAGEQVARDDARAELEQLRAALRARVATVPDAKDVAGTPGLGSSSALGVTGVMGHPGVAAAVADSALCLLVGTPMSVTARTGLDDALAAVSVYSIGSTAPYVPCTHVYTDDLRGSLSLLRLALTGHGRASHTRVPDTVSHTELQLPTFDGPGVRYRDAMTVLDSVLPDGVDIVVDAGQHRRGGDPPSAGAPRRPVPGGARHGWHGLQLRRRRRVWRSGDAAARWSSPATARSSCTAWRFTPRCSTGCR